MTSSQEFNTLLQQIIQGVNNSSTTTTTATMSFFNPTTATLHDESPPQNSYITSTTNITSSSLIINNSGSQMLKQLQQNQTVNDLDHDLNFDPDPVSDEVIAYVYTILLGFTCGLLSLLGIATNAINITVFSRQSFNETINISLLALAVSDLCSLVALLFVSVCFTPFFMYSPSIPVLAIEFQQFPGGWTHILFTRVTGLITVFITFERCLCIAFPLKVKDMLTPRRVKFIVIAIYVVVLGLGLPNYFGTLVGWKFVPELNRTMLGNIPTQFSAQIFKYATITQPFYPVISFPTVVVCTYVLITKLNQRGKWKQTNAHAGGERKYDDDNDCVSGSDVGCGNATTASAAIANGRDGDNGINVDCNVHNNCNIDRGTGINDIDYNNTPIKNEQPNIADNTTSTTTTSMINAARAIAVTTGSTMESLETLTINKDKIKKPNTFTTTKSTNNMIKTTGPTTTIKKDKSNKKPRAIIRDRQVVKMVTWVAVIFIISYTPSLALFVTMLVVPGFFHGLPYEKSFSVLLSVAFIFEAINSSINIFVYLKTSSNYRAKFNSLFCSRSSAPTTSRT